jgi:hypothetical protein
MIIRSILSVIIGCTFVLSITTAHAARDIQPSDKVAERIARTCKNLDDKDRERCVVREERKWWDSLSLTKLPVKHLEFLDKQDFGQGHLRERIKAERRTEFRKNIVDRKTYRQMRPTDDLNTQRKDYLNDLKMMRLECQLKPHGRQRALCIDEVGNWARKQMMIDTPSRRLPAS